MAGDERETRNVIDEDKATAGIEGRLQRLYGGGDICEMVEGRVADDRIEFLRQHEVIGIGEAIFDIWRRPLLACDGQHGVRDIQSQDKGSMPGKLAGEDTRATPNIENPATLRRQMLKKKSGAAFERSNEVVLACKVIEGLRIEDFQSTLPSATQQARLRDRAVR